MAAFIADILTAGLVSAGLTAFMLWLTKSWIGERLRNAIKAEYDQTLETHKAQLKSASDVEVERLKAQLSIAANEHHIVFSKLQEHRANVIAEMYGQLVEAYWAFQSFVSPFEMGGEPKKSEKYVTALNKSTDFFRYFEKNKIYLPEELCAQIDEFLKNMRKEAIGFGVYVQYGEERLPDHTLRAMHEKWTAASTYFDTEVPKAKKALENELRRLIGAA